MKVVLEDYRKTTYNPKTHCLFCGIKTDYWTSIKNKFGVSFCYFEFKFNEHNLCYSCLQRTNIYEFEANFPKFLKRLKKEKIWHRIIKIPKIKISSTPVIMIGPE